jgi:hypothetical protein
MEVHYRFIGPTTFPAIHRVHNDHKTLKRPSENVPRNEINLEKLYNPVTAF